MGARLPWKDVHPVDWLLDKELHRTPAAVRGIWIDWLMHMWAGDRTGILFGDTSALASLGSVDDHDQVMYSALWLGFSGAAEVWIDGLKIGLKTLDKSTPQKDIMEHYYGALSECPIQNPLFQKNPDFTQKCRKSSAIVPQAIIIVNRRLYRECKHDYKQKLDSIPEHIISVIRDGSVQQILRKSSAIVPQLHTHTHTQSQTNTENTNPCSKDSFGVDFGIPSNLDNEAFKTIWADFLAHRKQLKKKLTQTAAKTLLVKLSGWGLARASTALTHSIANGWTGVFEPSMQSQPPMNGNGQHKRPDPPSSISVREDT